jgi:hypothetical protein
MVSKRRSRCILCIRQVSTLMIPWNILWASWLSSASCLIQRITTRIRSLTSRLLLSITSLITCSTSKLTQMARLSLPMKFNLASWWLCSTSVTDLFILVHSPLLLATRTSSGMSSLPCIPSNSTIWIITIRSSNLGLNQHHTLKQKETIELQEPPLLTTMFSCWMPRKSQLQMVQLLRLLPRMLHWP